MIFFPFLPTRPRQICLVTCLGLLVLGSARPAARVFEYREQTGKESFIYQWRTEPIKNGVTITVVQHQGQEVYTSVNTKEGETLSWRYVHKPDTEVAARREGERIVFTGTWEGQAVQREERIDERPWYQPLSFSLSRMLAHNRSAVSFWTVRPDNLDVLAMEAEKKERQVITAEKEQDSWEADRVVIHLEGLLSTVWQAEYWFRSSDHLFVHYRGVHGPPGTEATFINLVQQR